MNINTHSVDQTEEAATRLAQTVHEPLVIAFTGDLGAGKTAFIRGFAKGLGFDGNVCSPTFNIVNCYTGGRMPLYHFDMYRIGGWDDLYTTGYFDYMEHRAVLAVEWSENIAAALPERRLDIDIRRADGDNDRVITLTPRGGYELEDFGC